MPSELGGGVLGSMFGICVSRRTSFEYFDPVPVPGIDRVPLSGLVRGSVDGGRKFSQVF